MTTIQRDFHTLARLEVAFATIGLLAAAGNEIAVPHGISILDYTLSGAFLAFVLYAGNELRRGTRRGVVLSLVAQGLQLVHLNVSWLSFLFLAGPSIELGVSRGAVLMTASAGSVAALTPIQPTSPVAGLLLSYHFGFLFNTDFRDTTVLAGINLVALSFAARLWRIRSLVTPHSSAQGVHESPAA